MQTNETTKYMSIPSNATRTYYYVDDTNDTTRAIQYLPSATNSNKAFEVDRNCTKFKTGDAVAVQHGNRARLEYYSDKSCNSRIIGKVIYIINQISEL